MTEKLLYLYSFRRCPYAIRARMALAAFHVNYWIREVDLKQKPVEMLTVSPKGTVPVLVLPDGQVIDESLDILIWLNQEGVSNVFKRCDDIKTHPLMDQLSHLFIPSLNRYKYPDRYDPSETVGAEERIIEYLNVLNGILGQQTFLSGAAPTVLDIAIYPLIRQYLRIINETLDEIYTPLMRWYSTLTAMPMFQDLMKAYDQWVPPSKGVLVTNA